MDTCEHPEHWLAKVPGGSGPRRQPAEGLLWSWGMEREAKSLRHRQLEVTEESSLELGLPEMIVWELRGGSLCRPHHYPTPPQA